MRIKTFITAVIIGAAVLTGCNKDRNEVAVANPDSSTTTDPNNPTVSMREVPVTYQIDPVMVDGPISRSSFDWVSAQGMVTDIKFEAKSDAGDVAYRSNTDRRVELFSPDINIGDITIPAGTYDKIKYKIRFAPTLAYPALQLNGQLMRDGLTIPVRFVINDPLELKVNGQDIAVINSEPYLSTLILQIMNLTQGITADIMDNATVSTNSEILVSETSNINIYNTLFNNLTDDDFLKVKLDKKGRK